MTTEASTHPRPARRRLRWVAAAVAWLLATLLALVLLALLAGPGLIQRELARQLSTALHREVTVERLELHPLSLSAVLQGLSVKNGHGGELAGLDRLELAVSRQSWSQRALVVERLRVQGLRLAVTHLGQGRYDISDLLDAWTQQGTSGGAVPPFVLHDVEFTDGRLVFDDRPRARVHTVEHLQLSLPLLSSLSAQRAVLAQPVLSATVDGASLRVTAQTAPFADTRAGTLNLALEHLDLAPLRVYLPPGLPVQPARGRLDAQAQLSFALPAQQALQLTLNGQARLSDFQLDDAQGQSLLAFKTLALEIARADLAGRDIALGQVTLDVPQLGLGIDRDGRFHLAAASSSPRAAASLMTASAAVTPSATASAASTATTTLQATTTSTTSAAASTSTSAAPPWALRIARVTVRDGVLVFTDDSVQPGFRARIDALAGDVTGLSTQANSVADLALHGRYAQNAPVTIQARLNPLAVQKFLDLRAKIDNVELTHFSTYAGKYAGYTIEKGKFSLDAAYRLHDGRLRAENHLFIDQFTFGQRVESPSATDLPVSLAIALLKNTRGEIELDLPVTGSLDDPQFSMRGLIGKMIVNLIVKVVSSPFTLLSSLFGDGAELSALDFAPGMATIDDAGRHKLAALARAMQARDALTLEVRGLFDAARDAQALAAQRPPTAGTAGQTGAPATRVAAAGPATAAAVTAATVTVTADARDLEPLAALARRRAQNVTHWLIEEGHVPPERIFELASGARTEAQAAATGVAFSLR